MSPHADRGDHAATAQGAIVLPSPSRSERREAVSTTGARAPMMQVLWPRACQGKRQDPSAAADAVGSPFGSPNGGALRGAARDYSSAW